MATEILKGRDRTLNKSYLNQKQDLPPSNLVLWRGMSRLTDIHFGYCLAKDVGN